MKFSILYRGPLSSCNYGCSYCPFAKKRETRAELEKDRRALERFVAWATGRADDEISILFTPWGEALVRRWYQDSLASLSHLRQIRRVAIQTNLSCRLDWIDRCNKEALALWCTFHPSEAKRERFVTQCYELDRRGVRFSVGAVGLKEFEHEIRALRQELPAHIYVWINAYKNRPDYYVEDDLRRLEKIDPLFRINARDYRSAGRECWAGESVVSVDGDGTIRRCHFIREPIGNIYDPGIEAALKVRRCTNPICRCHIGYVHLKELNLYPIFEDGVLERIPTSRRSADNHPDRQTRLPRPPPGGKSSCPAELE